MTATLVLIGAVAFALGAYGVWRRARARSGIAPASVLQERFGLYAGNRPRVDLDPLRVPAHLRHLVPLAATWGIADDIIRNDVVEKASNEEKHQLHDALFGPYEQINEWLASFTTQPLSREAEAFMYMQTALDEMGYYLIDEKQPPRESP